MLGPSEGALLGLSCVSIKIPATHDNPNKAPSDGPNMIHINQLEKLLKKIKLIDNIVKK